MTGTEAKLRAEQSLIVSYGVLWWWWSGCGVGRAVGRGCWRDGAVGEVPKDRRGKMRAVLVELQARVQFYAVAGVGGQVVCSGMAGGMQEWTVFRAEESAVLFWWSGIGSGHGHE